MRFSWFLLVVIECVNSISLNQNLSEVLLKNSTRLIRPVMRPGDVLEIHIQSALYQIVEINQSTNLACIAAYFDMWWYDPNLTWDPSEFDGVTKTYLPASKVWMPDLYLYHSVMGSTPFSVEESAAQIIHDGKVSVFVPFTAKAFCPINVKHFPFDNQFGSWSYTSDHLIYVVDNKQVYLGGFYDNQEWLLMHDTFLPNISEYSTPEHTDTYSIVIMTLWVSRQGFYYVFNLVIPSTMVAIVFVVGVHVPTNSSGPPRRDSRFRLGITTLLSMGVMLLMLVEDMPKFASRSIEGQRGSFSSVPLLGIYYISLITLVSTCTITSTIFLKLERYATKNKGRESIPFVLRCLAPAISEIDLSSRGEYHELQSPKLIESYVHSNPRGDKSDRVLCEIRDLIAEICSKLDAQVRRNQELLEARVLPRHWDVVIKRVEKISLIFYLSVICVVIIMLIYPEAWY